MNNNDLRNEMLKKRWSLSLVEKQKFDHQIFKKTVEELKNHSKEKYIGCYWPIENEVDCIAITKSLLDNGYKVCIPAIIGDKMEYKQIETLGFEFETWKCMRQPKTKKTVNKSEIETILVPMIAFTEKGYRLGYGKNFYNFFLRGGLKIKTIGIAYAFQKVEEILLTENDIKLDKIITN